MGGGGGGGGGYDDAWIRNWTRDAEGREAGYRGRIDNLTSWNTDRMNENRTQSGQIGDLFGRTDAANRRLNEISGIQNTFEQRIGRNYSDIAGLRTNLSNLETLVNTPTTTGDVQGLDNIISNLQSRYTTADRNIGNLRNQLSSTERSIRSDTKSQLDRAISDLGINQYLKTSDFNTRMSDNLGALGDTLRGEFGADIAALDLPGVRDAISSAQGDIGSLTEDFAGLSSDMDWIKKLDLEGFDDRLSEQGANIRSEFKGDLTDLQNILESGRGEALANLENQLGKDRAADILQLRQDIESGRASEIEALAGNLRQEYGDQLFDLSNTFDDRLSGLQSDLGGSIQDLFGDTGELRSGLDTLTSDLGTTSQQLGALRDSFGDYQTQAASNLSDVRSALQTEIGDVEGSLTAGLSDLGTSLRGEASDALADVYQTRQQALSGLEGRFGENLRAQEEGFTKRMDEQTAAIDDKIGRLGSMMNYRMLGDSAGGVKMRRSKAYKSGAINTGTGQLSRSMKLKTLNI